MSPSLIFLIAAAVCFILEAIEVRSLPLKWWALGVAFYLLSLAAA